jgi:hypothetical protein
MQELPRSRSFFVPMPVGTVNDIGLNLKILVNEFSRVIAVSPDATHLGRRQENILRLNGLKENIGVRLVEQIKLRPRTADDIGKALRCEEPGNCTSNPGHDDRQQKFERLYARSIRTRRIRRNPTAQRLDHRPDPVRPLPDLSLVQFPFSWSYFIPNMRSRWAISSFEGGLYFTCPPHAR